MMKNFFDKCYCINLSRSKDRWDKFARNIPLDWPFRDIERFNAIDGLKVRPPAFWKKGPLAWGCYRSHLSLLEHALNEGFNNILIMEDDVIFESDFKIKVSNFLQALPKDWEMIYLGGQHMNQDICPPLQINDEVLNIYSVNRTHAYAIKREYMVKLYQFLSNFQDHGKHLDRKIREFQEINIDNRQKVYAPTKWLTGQDEGNSLINSRNEQTRFWSTRKKVKSSAELLTQFVAVIGLHSSGSSCLAGVLYHLGVHMGNKLVGHYGRNPDANCGFEALGLRNICAKALPFPKTEFVTDNNSLKIWLAKWIIKRTQEAKMKGTIAGGKYPYLCRMGDLLQEICGSQLKILIIDRPLNQSISSLQKRYPEVNPGLIKDHQIWLNEGKAEIINNFSQQNMLIINYDQLLTESAKTLEKIITFLELNPDHDQLVKAKKWINPSKKHIKT